MATTTNYGWDTPDDTDLVKDGAAAIRTLGSSVDTTTKNLNPQTTTGALAYRSATANINTALPIGTAGQILAVSGGVPAWINNDQGDITEVQAGTGISVASGTGPIPVVTNTVATAIDAKGDLIVGTGADAFARLAVGTNGHTLVADSVEATGLKWVAPSSGGMTLISTTSINASSTTISSIPTTYKHLLILGKDIYANTNDTGTGIAVRFNSDTGNNYYMYLVRSIGGSQQGGSDGITSRIDVTERISSSQTIDKLSEFELWAYRYTDTDTVSIYNRGYGHSGSAGAWLVNTGRYDNSAAITSVTILNPNSNTLTGTIYVYGVS